jgi:hypothetical protein
VLREVLEIGGKEGAGQYHGKNGECEDD